MAVRTASQPSREGDQPPPNGRHEERRWQTGRRIAADGPAATGRCGGKPAQRRPVADDSRRWRRSEPYVDQWIVLPPVLWRVRRSRWSCPVVTHSVPVPGVKPEHYRWVALAVLAEWPPTVWATLPGIAGATEQATDEARLVVVIDDEPSMSLFAAHCAAVTLPLSEQYVGQCFIYVPGCRTVGVRHAPLPARWIYGRILLFP
jgi:hypothetical protein